MKARPRRIEREAAKHLSVFFRSLGLDDVERQPVIGRTGPDITLNDFQLVVDVKSRKSVPITPMLMKEDKIIVCSDRWIGCRLGNPRELLDITPKAREVRDFKMIGDWLDHMDEWTTKYCPEGITALILHIPGMPVKNSLLLVKFSHKERFYERCNLTTSVK
jgi:hypothetical protein